MIAYGALPLWMVLAVFFVYLSVPVLIVAAPWVGYKAMKRSWSGVSCCCLWSLLGVCLLNLYMFVSLWLMSGSERPLEIVEYVWGVGVAFGAILTTFALVRYNQDHW